MKNPEADQPNPEDWDDLFRQRFAEFQSEPRPNALARILASLPRATPAFDRRKAWLLGGLGLLLLLGGIWFVSQRSSRVSTSLTAKSINDHQPTRVSAKRPPDATTISQNRRSSEASKPTANGRASEAFATDKTNPASSDSKIITEAGDKAVNDSERKPGVDHRGEAETFPIKQEALASATSKALLPTANRENASARNVVRTEVETRHSKNSVKSSHTAAKTTSASQTSPYMAVSQANSTKELSTPTGKSRQLPQPTSHSSTLPPTDQQQSDQQSLSPVPQAVSLSLLTSQPLQPIRWSLSLPDITLSSLPQSAPQQPTMSRKRPVVLIGVMPLYTYQQITPVATDAVWVKNVRSQRALSGHRAGLRLQAAVEWPLSQQVSIRTSLIYNHLSQQVSYTTPSDKPDSIRVERVDDKTVRLTPYYSDTQVTRQTNWHYVGIGSDVVWQLGKLGAWRHYASAGASVGTYLAQGASQTTQPLSGFVQAAYGIERPLTPSVWLRIAPTVQYGLSTINDSDGLFHSRPYTYGVTISLRK